MSKSIRKPLQALAGWFERQKRVLPWRDDPSLYRVWISEIMLQQTQVVTVIPYFERFLKRFPSVNVLAQATEQDVLEQWAGLGYYARARNLRRAAQEIVRHGFPETHEGWLDLPGIGPYTAGAITSIALDQPTPILDGNVERVLSRVARVSRQNGDTKYKAELWELSRKWVEAANRLGIRPSVLNQALMELGAIVCAPKPRCQLCPVSPICQAHASGEEERYPPKKPRKSWLEVREKLHCVITAQGDVLLEKRKPGEWRAGLWDLTKKKPSLAKRLGSVRIQYVVTRHKVTRTTDVWLTRRPSKSAQWFPLRAPTVPVGSPLKKTLQTVLETFPEVSPRS